MTRNSKPIEPTSMQKITVLCTIFLIASCAGTYKVMNFWLGSAKQQLIMNRGSRIQTTDGGVEGKILVYARQDYIPPSSFTENNGNATTTQEHIEITKSFECEGKIHR